MSDSAFDSVLARDNRAKGRFLSLGRYYAGVALWFATFFAGLVMGHNDFPYWVGGLICLAASWIYSAIFDKFRARSIR